MAQQAKKQKSLENKVKDDVMTLKWLDGKKVKQSILEPFNLAATEVSGTGLSGFEIDFKWYDGRKVFFTASPDSTIRVSSAPGKPLLKNAFRFIWSADEGKDQENKARLAIHTC